MKVIIAVTCLIIAGLWILSFQNQEKVVYLPLSSSSLEIVTHKNYTLGYSEKHEQAAWVYYYLDISKLNPEIKRNDSFTEDLRVSTGSSHRKDYKKSGYDRGHLSPAADNKLSMEIMEESFYMSNMSPQAPYFNRGIWRLLEEEFRDRAREMGPLHIVTAGVLTDTLPAIGENEVSIPDYYYKIGYQDSLQLMMAYLLRNEKSNQDFEEFAVSVDSVEKITGLDFFPQLEDSLEAVLESAVYGSSER